MRKALLMLFGLKKHDLCFLVTLSRIGEYVVLWILEMSYYWAINVRQVVGDKGCVSVQPGSQ